MMWFNAETTESPVTTVYRIAPNAAAAIVPMAYSDVFVYTEANLHGSCAFVWVYPPALSTDATVPRNVSWEFKINAVLLDTNDLGEAEALLSASYSKTHFRVASNLPTRTQVARSTLGPLAFDELRYNYVFGYESDPADGVVLCRVKSGSLLFQ